MNYILYNVSRNKINKVLIKDKQYERRQHKANSSYIGNC